MANVAFVESIMCTEYLLKHLCNRPKSLPKGLRGTCNIELALGVAHEIVMTDPYKYKPENPRDCVKYVETGMLLLFADSEKVLDWCRECREWAARLARLWSQRCDDFVKADSKPYDNSAVSYDAASTISCSPCYRRRRRIEAM